MSFYSLTFVFITLSLLPNAIARELDTYCDISCQLNYGNALKTEFEQWINIDVILDPFYRNPWNLSKYATGDIIKWEHISADEASNIWSIPNGISLSRFLYMSEDIDGNPIPASAFALVPDSNPRGREPFPVVAWAHGTSGGARKCAPSNNKILFYGMAGPFALARQGYAVVATDYAGQGTDIPGGFKYVAGILHANDVSFSVKAARKALGEDVLSKKWVVVGHSEGALAAWRTNEREAKASNAIGGFLGAVSIAPVMRLIDMLSENIRNENSGPVGNIVLVYGLLSLSRLYPSFRFHDYISDVAANRTALADSGCLVTGTYLFSDLTVKQVLKDQSLTSDPIVLDWARRYVGVGPHAIEAPMLVIQGLEDTIAYPTLTIKEVDQTCDAYPESSLELLLYPDFGHDTIHIAAQTDFLRWIEDRFNSVRLEPGCSKTTKQAIPEEM